MGAQAPKEKQAASVHEKVAMEGLQLASVSKKKKKRLVRVLEAQGKKKHQRQHNDKHVT